MHTSVETPNDALALHNFDSSVSKTVVLLRPTGPAIHLPYTHNHRTQSRTHARTHAHTHTHACMRAHTEYTARTHAWAVVLRCTDRARHRHAAVRQSRRALCMCESSNFSQDVAPHTLKCVGAGRLGDAPALCTCICTRITSRGWQQVAAPMPAAGADGHVRHGHVRTG